MHSSNMFTSCYESLEGTVYLPHQTTVLYVEVLSRFPVRVFQKRVEFALTHSLCLSIPSSFRLVSPAYTGQSRKEKPVYRKYVLCSFSLISNLPTYVVVNRSGCLARAHVRCWCCCCSLLNQVFRFPRSSKREQNEGPPPRGKCRRHLAHMADFVDDSHYLFLASVSRG